MRLHDTFHTSGSILLEMQWKPVYYVDGLPCVIYTEKETTAHIGIIDDRSFSVSDAYLASYNGCIAHGDTLRAAIEDAKCKYFSSQSFEVNKAMFIETFTLNGIYKAHVFYKWHGILTGSCTTGRNAFISEKEIDLNDNVTVSEFFDLVKGEFGHVNIEKVIREMQDIKGDMCG